MSHDRMRTQTLVPKELLPEYVFPDQAPEELLQGLTAIERQFVRRYVETGNAHESFLASGLEHGQKRTKTLASSYLHRPKIRSAVHRLQAYYAHHMGIHASHILGLLHAHGTFDPMTIYEKDGESWELKPMSRWTLEARQSVQRVRVIERTSKDGEVRREIDLEFADRQRALITLAKHLRLLERKDQIAPFTLILNANPEPVEKRVGEVIKGIGLEINLPELER